MLRFAVTGSFQHCVGGRSSHKSLGAVVSHSMERSMPWEVTIVNATDRSKSLGSRAGVVARFAGALPGVYLEPAPGPSPEWIAQMPAVMQEHFKRPRQLNAIFEGRDFSIEFYANDEATIDAVGAEIRGNGNPVPALSALCIPNGWAVVNAADGAAVDLSSEESPVWAEFRAWRDEWVVRVVCRPPQ
jgi:hypothetical protein